MIPFLIGRFLAGAAAFDSAPNLTADMAPSAPPAKAEVFRNSLRVVKGDLFMATANTHCPAPSTPFLRGAGVRLSSINSAQLPHEG
jgi:hypothetical protein